MLNRRELGSLALLAFAATAHEAAAQSLPASARGDGQSEYLFWLSNGDRHDVRRVAESVLSELDAGPGDRARLAGVHGRAASVHQRRYTESAFADRIVKTRGTRGGVRERAFQGVEGGFRFLPNFPDGEYAIAVFDTIFSQDRDIQTEQLTLGRDPVRGNGWFLVDYYLGQKPYYKY